MGQAMDQLYPFKSNYLELGKHRMHYVDEGQGPVVLMLHGNPTWSFYYRNLITALRGQYRAIAPDHIGCGLSDKPQAYNYTLSTHIDNVSRLVEKLNLDEITLVVHDWGGAIGFGLALKYPKLFKRLIVLNTSAFIGPCPFRLRVAQWPILGELFIRGCNGFARGALRQALVNPESLSTEVKQGYLLPYDNYANRIATLAFVRDIPFTKKSPSYAVLKKIDARLESLSELPMLICWGEQDFCFNDWYLQAWIQRFPNANVHRFPNASHYVLEEQADEIIPLVQAFLQ